MRWLPRCLCRCPKSAHRCVELPVMADPKIVTDRRASVCVGVVECSRCGRPVEVRLFAWDTGACELVPTTNEMREDEFREATRNILAELRKPSLRVVSEAQP